MRSGGAGAARSAVAPLTPLRNLRNSSSSVPSSSVPGERPEEGREVLRVAAALVRDRDRTRLAAGRARAPHRDAIGAARPAAPPRPDGTQARDVGSAEPDAEARADFLDDLRRLEDGVLVQKGRREGDRAGPIDAELLADVPDHSRADRLRVQLEGATDRGLHLALRERLVLHQQVRGEAASLRDVFVHGYALSEKKLC